MKVKFEEEKWSYLIKFGPTWIILPDISGWKYIQSGSSEQHFISCMPFFAWRRKGKLRILLYLKSHRSNLERKYSAPLHAPLKIYKYCWQTRSERMAADINNNNSDSSNSHGYSMEQFQHFLNMQWAMALYHDYTWPNLS